MPPRSYTDEWNVAPKLVFTLVVLLLGALIVLLSVPRITSPKSANYGQTLSNARQLYIAGFSMAVDYGTTGDELLGWPGDLAERKVKPVTTITGYIQRLIQGDYLREADMRKILQTQGVPQWKKNRPFSAEYCPFKIYRVKESDPANALFCASKNFTYNKGLDARQEPWRDKGFIVFRKGGNGAVFNSPKQVAKNLSSAGLLPGRADYETRKQEMPVDYLEPM